MLTLPVLARCQRARPPLSRRALRCRAARAEPEPELGVFRFTLGSKWVDDNEVPRLLGLISLGLLALNHAQTGSGGDALSRTEALGVLVAGLSTLVPWAQRLLADEEAAQPAAEDEATQQTVFLLSDGLDEASRAELAWATFVLLSNTEAASCLIWRNGRLECVRGRVSRALQASLGELATAMAPMQATALGTGEAAVSTLNASRAMSLFGSQPGTLLVEPMGQGGACLLFSPLPDAFGRGATRAWVRSLAAKLQQSLP